MINDIIPTHLIIKNSDTLIEKQILIPNKFKICESVQNFV